MSTIDADRRTNFLSAIALLFGTTIAAAAQDDGQREATDRTNLAAFRYDAALADVGRVFHYRHSNVDGTHASRVALYWAAPDRLESLKWNPGWTASTLVTATMDWETFSVDAFESFDVAPEGRTQKARLETADDKLVVGGGALRCDIESVPWHSYDFDFASLNVSLRFLVDPTAPVRFAVADTIRVPGKPPFGFKGEVELSYESDEERGGVPCRKYLIDGPGLEFRGGTLWASKGERSHFVDFEIDLPDEPNLTSGKLTLLDMGELTAEEWQAFVEASVRPD